MSFFSSLLKLCGVSLALDWDLLFSLLDFAWLFFLLVICCSLTNAWMCVCMYVWRALNCLFLVFWLYISLDWSLLLPCYLSTVRNYWVYTCKGVCKSKVLNVVPVFVLLLCEHFVVTTHTCPDSLKRCCNGNKFKSWVIIHVCLLVAQFLGVVIGCCMSGCRASQFCLLSCDVSSCRMWPEHLLCCFWIAQLIQGQICLLNPILHYVQTVRLTYCGLSFPIRLATMYSTWACHYGCCQMYNTAVIT